MLHILHRSLIKTSLAFRRCQFTRNMETAYNAQHLIEANTTISDVYGIKLRLITEENSLFYCSDESKLPFPEPWWAFLWPGGRALTRYIVENPQVFKNKSVLEIGCGCGSASIAAALAGASKVVANDICRFSEAAVSLNMKLNNLDDHAVVFDIRNKIGLDALYFDQFDIVVCGDMLYDENISSYLLQSIKNHKCVVFGDPSRTYCPKGITDSKYLLAEYPYQEDGFYSTKVFRLTPELLSEQ